jgi:hypothetical protein
MGNMGFWEIYLASLSTKLANFRRISSRIFQGISHKNKQLSFNVFLKLPQNISKFSLNFPSVFPISLPIRKARKLQEI